MQGAKQLEKLEFKEGAIRFYNLLLKNYRRCTCYAILIQNKKVRLQYQEAQESTWKCMALQSDFNSSITL
jgi:hypothetical protein